MPVNVSVWSTAIIMWINHHIIWPLFLSGKSKSEFLNY